MGPHNILYTAVALRRDALVQWMCNWKLRKILFTRFSVTQHRQVTLEGQNIEGKIKVINQGLPEKAVLKVPHHSHESQIRTSTSSIVSTRFWANDTTNNEN